MPVIGTLTVNLEANTAAFSGDLGKASGALDRLARDAKDAGGKMDYSMRDARGALLLMGEDFGIRLPREIRTMIAEVPAIGVALEALLPIMGVVFAVDLIYKWVEAHEKAAKALQAAWDKSGATTAEILDHLQDKLLEVGIKADELSGNHIGKLKKELELIDRQTLAGIISELDKLGKEADNVFEKMQSNWFLQLLMGRADVGPAKTEIAAMVAEIDKLKGTGADPGNVTRALLGADVDKVKGEITSLQSQIKGYSAENSAARKSGDAFATDANDRRIIAARQALDLEKQNLATLETMQQVARENVEVGTGEKKNDTTKEGQDEDKRAKKQLETNEKIRAEIAKAKKQMLAEEEKYADEISKLESYRLSSQLKSEQKAADERLKIAKDEHKRLFDLNKDQDANLEHLQAYEDKKVAIIKEREQNIRDEIARTTARSIVEGQNMLSAFRQLGAQMLEQVLENMMKQNAAEDMQQVKDAGHAAASAFKWVMKTVPFPADFVIAPIAAAAAFAGVMAFEQGGEIPGMGPVPILGHGGETVVTKALTDQVKNNAGSGDRGQIVFAPTVHAVDAEGVDRMLKKHGATFERHYKATLRKHGRG